MTDAGLVPTDALSDTTVAISVSDSADLARLGLHPKHVEYAVAEIARAVLTAGGHVVYGGRIHPSGYTQFLMHELRRYGGRGHRLTICVAYPEHRKLTLTKLRELDEDLHASCRLRFLTPDGEQADYRTGRGEDPPDDEEDPEQLAASYSAMRRHLSTISDARIVVGGQLAGFAGAMPGIIEEAVSALRSEHPLYVAGGFGGAAALAARHVDLADHSWLPDDVPAHDPDDTRISGALAELREFADTRRSLIQAGLDDNDRAQLTWSHRPGDIASLFVLGLSRTVAT